jgi:rubrerythrin
MKLIIDIPKEEYEEFKKSVTFLQSIGVDFSEMRQYMLAIANGTILEQEPKISKEKAIEILKADNIAGYSVEDILKARDMAIKAIKQEPRKGHWLHRPHVYGVAYCSICDFELKIDNTNYCPHCGAKMESEE